MINDVPIGLENVSGVEEERLHMACTPTVRQEEDRPPTCLCMDKATATTTNNATQGWSLFFMAAQRLHVSMKSTEGQVPEQTGRSKPGGDRTGRLSFPSDTACDEHRVSTSSGVSSLTNTHPFPPCQWTCSPHFLRKPFLGNMRPQ